MLEKIANGDSFVENAVTKRYMSRHGVENVRGGAYCTLTLDQQTRAFLERELNTGCYYCHSPGHFVANCDAKRRADAERNFEKKTEFKLLCRRCFRYGDHVTRLCSESKDLFGNELPIDASWVFTEEAASKPVRKQYNTCVAAATSTTTEEAAPEGIFATLRNFLKSMLKD